MSHCCLIDRQCGFYVWGGLTCFIDSVRERLTTAAVCLADRTAMENQQATGTMAYGERWPMLLQAQTCTHTHLHNTIQKHTHKAWGSNRRVLESNSSLCWHNLLLICVITFTFLLYIGMSVRRFDYTLKNKGSSMALLQKFPFGTLIFKSVFIIKNVICMDLVLSNELLAMIKQGHVLFYWL